MKIGLIRPVVIVISLFVISTLCQSKTLNMGFFALPPHSMRIGNNAEAPTGAGITYFEMIALKAGYQVKWSELPLLRLTEYLRVGQVDGTVSFPKFPVFESFMHYGVIPMYFGQPVFVVSKDSPLDAIYTIEDIKGFRIGVVHSKSNRYTPIIDQNRDKIILEELPNLSWVKLNILKLVNGRMDAFFDRQQYAIPYVAKTLGVDSRIKILDAPAPAAPFYIVLSKAVKENQVVIKKINKVLLTSPPDYEKLLKEEFDRLNTDQQVK